MIPRACQDFRDGIGRPPGSGAPTDAGHWLDCADCRAYLDREQALERLLDSPADDQAPPDLAARVLAGLEPARAAADQRRERALDALLELVPEPEVPAGLARTVLAGLAPARAPRRRGPARRRLVSAAALVLFGLALWLWARNRTALPAPALVLDEEAQDQLEADEELLEYALRRWELLTDDDPDLWFASLDPGAEILMEHSGSEALLGLEEAGTPSATGRERRP